LPAVCQEQTRVGIAQPADLNSASTEGANVGEESLDTSEAKQYTTETSPSVILAADEVVKGIEWVETLQYRVIVPDAVSKARQKLDASA
jgi:hypothetical protein